MFDLFSMEFNLNVLVTLNLVGIEASRKCRRLDGSSDGDGGNIIIPASFEFTGEAAPAADGGR